MADVPGLSILQQASAQAMPGHPELTLGQFASQSTNVANIIDRAKSTKKNDMYVAYCKTMKCLWQLEEVMKNTGVRPGPAVPPRGTPQERADAAGSVILARPKVRAMDPNSPDTPDMHNASSWSHSFAQTYRACVNWRSWPFVGRALGIAITLMSLMAPQLIIHFLAQWARTVAHSMYAEVFISVYSGVSVVSRPVWEPIYNASNYIEEQMGTEYAGSTCFITFVSVCLGHILKTRPAHP